MIKSAIEALHSKPFKLLLSYIIDLANVLSNSTRKTQGFQFSSLSQVRQHLINKHQHQQHQHQPQNNLNCCIRSSTHFFSAIQREISGGQINVGAPLPCRNIKYEGARSGFLRHGSPRPLLRSSKGYITL